MTTKTNDVEPINVDIGAIDSMKTHKTFTLANVARALNHNPKMVRSRFRKYDKNENEKYNVVRATLKNAKSRWVYPIDCIDAIIELIKRDDDE